MDDHGIKNTNNLVQFREKSQEVAANKMRLSFGEITASAKEASSLT
jgi:hypothetical protein